MPIKALRVQAFTFHIRLGVADSDIYLLVLHSGQLLANILLSRSDRTCQMCAIEIPIPYMSAGY